MIYRFRSRNDADVIMTQAVAERVLKVLGKDAGRDGILEPAQMPAALAALEAAVGTDDLARAAPVADDAREETDDGPAADNVSLRRRIWPLVEMIKRAQADDTPVTWHA
jgi:hypothetical protein